MSHLSVVADATPDHTPPARTGRYRHLRTAQHVPEPREGWQEDTLCREVDPEAFFPEKGETSAVARRICAGCDVREDCLNYGLVHGGRDGVWGGLGQTQLQAERKRLGLPHAYIVVDIPDTTAAVRPDDDGDVSLLSMLGRVA